MNTVRLGILRLGKVLGMAAVGIAALGLAVLGLAGCQTAPSVVVEQINWTLLDDCYTAKTCKFILPYFEEPILIPYADAPILFNKVLIVQIRGIDVPQEDGECQSERELAVEARAFLRKLLAQAWLDSKTTGTPGITFRNLELIKLPKRERKRDSRGKITSTFRGRSRAVADIVIGDDESVAELMIAAGYARDDGGPRLTWCQPREP